MAFQLFLVPSPCPQLHGSLENQQQSSRGSCENSIPTSRGGREGFELLRKSRTQRITTMRPVSQLPESSTCTTSLYLT